MMESSSQRKMLAGSVEMTALLSSVPTRTCSSSTRSRGLWTPLLLTVSLLLPSCTTAIDVSKSDTGSNSGTGTPGGASTNQPQETSSPDSASTADEPTGPTDPEGGKEKPGGEQPKGEESTGEEKGGKGEESKGEETGEKDEKDRTGEKTEGPTSEPEKTSESTEEPTTTEEPPKCEKGQKKPCSELEDGTPISYPGGEPQGSCKRGVSKCEGGEWGKCVGAVAPAAKDTCEPGNDDNCNGKPTDHCDCSPGEKKPCGSDVGECRKGRMTCDSEGQWGKGCVGEVKPSRERCDGRRLDEDCNGMADLEDPRCECIDGTVEACSLNGQGDCALGKRTCTSGRFSRCMARFPKMRSEQCGRRTDGLESKLGPAPGDENCNGQTDETDWSSPRPQGCTMYMVDKDGDGFGAKGEDLARAGDASRATYGCVCSGNVPSGWTRAPRRAENSDCGDCVIGGSEVKPSRSVEPKDVPSRCLESLGYKPTFDYNCSGGIDEDPQQQGQFECTYDSARNRCVATGYWYEPKPSECGVEASIGTAESHCVLRDDESGCSRTLLRVSEKKRCM